MPRWLIGVLGGIGVVVAIFAMTILVLEFQFRRELKRRSEHEIWHTTGSPMVWHLED